MPSRVRASMQVPETEKVKRWLSSPPFKSANLVNPRLLDSGTVNSSRNLIVRNEMLTYDQGWRRLEDAGTNPLPLGGDTTPFPGAGAGSPVVALSHYPDTMGATFEATLALTSNTAANGPGTIFYYDHGSATQWNEATDFDAVGFLTDSTHVYDHALYPNSYMTGALAPPKGSWIVTNGVRDVTNARVAHYPSSAGWGFYQSLLVPTGTPDLTPFGCRSVAVANERIYVLNTLEGALANRHKPQRLRWTSIGFPYINTTNWNDPGAGALDLTRFRGEGVKVLQIGTRLAVYFEDGVALLQWTGSRPPHTIAYESRQRGLLGTRAVVDIGGSIHFGVFTDGFWLFTEQGEWREFGAINEGGIKFRPFADYFFATRNKSYDYRVTVFYDSERRLIELHFANGATNVLNERWILDIQTEQAFKMDSVVSGLTEQYANCGAFTRNRDSSAMRLARGTNTGYVWENITTSLISTTALRDGVAPTWDYKTEYVDYGDPTSHHRLLATVLDLGVGGTSAVSYTVRSPEGNTFATTATPTGARQPLYFPTLGVTGHRHRHEFTGTHPTTLYSISHDITKISDALGRRL